MGSARHEHDCNVAMREFAISTTRFRVTSYYLIAYATTLVCFVVIWFRYPTLLYIGRDGGLTIWLAKAYLDWAQPFDVTSMNPLQGMTSMLMAINPYFNPAVWVFQTDVHETLKMILSFVVYFLEVTVSTFALGLTLGFSRPFSFVSALWLALLLFPPFNFVFGLAGWLATAPIYGHTLALSNLLLIAFMKMGATPHTVSFVRRLIWNWLLATAIFVLVLLIVLAAPFYNGGMLVGSLLLAGLIFLSSNSVQQVLWRSAAGVYVLICCGLLHFFEFFAGARAYSARFSEAKTFLPQIHWPDNFSPELIANARSWLCAAGIFCDRFTQLPLALTGSYWLHFSIILGGFLVAMRMPPPAARIGALSSALWIVLLIVWIGESFKIISPFPLSPLYFYLMMYPFWAFFSLYTVCAITDIIRARFVPRAFNDHVWICSAVCILALALLPLFKADISHVLRWRDPQLRGSTTAITDALRQEISLHPGQLYRGSVATLFGAPGSPLRKRLLGTTDAPLQPYDFEAFLGESLLDTGSRHDLLDLWWFDIPTLSEYGQGLSKPLMFYFSNVLNGREDAKDVNFGFPRVANTDILRSMGVRFIITDFELPADKARLRAVVPMKADIKLRLYEIFDPNLASFSPVKVSGPISPSELLERIGANPALFESEAFVDSSETRQLVPVQRSQMTFERGAVHVTASSAGPSALLLPLQFSHCFRLAAEHADRVKVLRANLIHTLVLFAGELDVRLKWQFSFWRNSGCRMRDAEDVRALGLR
jgi:hypothetical protein